MEPRGASLIARYRRNYSLPLQEELTEEMILRHWTLERELTQDLLRSDPAQRWEVFARCYSRLYSELTWLNRPSTSDEGRTNEYRGWATVIGRPPATVYEIGSGNGGLLANLTRCGFTCKGTEITPQRGERHAVDAATVVSWGVSDGVHLDRFELPETYNVVISNQVIEHLHPDDVYDHMKGAWRILKPGGRYVFSTPHCLTGPHDVSRVFGSDRPKGMHLKEYTYKDLVAILKDAGFRSVYHVGLVAKGRRVIAHLRFKPDQCAELLGTIHLRGLLGLEALLAGIPSRRASRWCSLTLHRLRIFSGNIFLVAQKQKDTSIASNR